MLFPIRNMATRPMISVWSASIKRSAMYLPPKNRITKAIREYAIPIMLAAFNPSRIRSNFFAPTFWPA